MTHGSEFDVDPKGGAKAPPIQGVRPEMATAPVTPFDVTDPVDDDIDAAATATAPSTMLDPWGAEDPAAFAPRRERVIPGVSHVPAPDPEYVDSTPAPRRRGGGVLTIPLLCVAMATIACVTLLPLADENHQLAWEREKLKADLAQLQEQGRVNDEFLKRVADDPTLAERLANRQMKYIRQGSNVLPLRGGQKEEMSPFHLVSVPPPAPMPPYQPVGGALATMVRQPRAQLYLCGGALLLIAAALVLGYVPKGKLGDED